MTTDTAAREPFEVCYPAGGQAFTPLLEELGIPVIWGPTAWGVGHVYDDRTTPRVPRWAAVVLNWMGLSTAERETALRRLAAEPALRATVRDLTQVIRTDAVAVAPQNLSFMPDRWQFSTSRFAQAWTTAPEWREELDLSYDHTGVILKIQPRDGGPMPLHVAVVVQQAIDEFVRGDAVMHALGSSR